MKGREGGGLGGELEGWGICTLQALDSCQGRVSPLKSSSGTRQDLGGGSSSLIARRRSAVFRRRGIMGKRGGRDEAGGERDRRMRRFFGPPEHRRIGGCRRASARDCVSASHTISQPRRRDIIQTPGFLRAWKAPFFQPEPDHEGLGSATRETVARGWRGGPRGPRAQLPRQPSNARSRAGSDRPIGAEAWGP